ncbi:hypothetical protein [Mycolicibacterium wolinskyi]
MPPFDHPGDWAAGRHPVKSTKTTQWSIRRDNFDHCVGPAWDASG